MAYMDSDDVASEFKNMTFDSSSSITDTEVDEICTQESNIVDSYVALKYTAPLTLAANPKSYSAIKSLAIKLAKIRVERILALRAGTDVDQESLSVSRQSVLDELKDMIAGNMLHDGSRLSANGYGIKDYNYANDISHSFKATETQW